MKVPFALLAPESRPYDAVGLGLNSIDLLVVVPGHPARNSKQRLLRFARLPGGQAATAMVTCARLGWRARYIGRFGDDDHGRFGRESLEQEGVDISGSRAIPGATNQFAVILVDETNGDRTIMWNRHPALTMTAADVPREAVCSGRVLMVDCHDTEAATQAAQYARAAAMPSVLDVEEVRPGIHDLLSVIDVIIASQDFPGRLTGHHEVGRALAALASEYPALVVCVTLGPEGSLTRCAGREIRTPGFVVPCIDSTGAGDVFRGGFVAGLLAAGNRGELENVLTYANAVAALKCRALGAREGIPNRTEIEQYLGLKPSEWLPV